MSIRKRVLKAFHSPSVSGWLARNPPKDARGNILMNGQRDKKINWTSFVLAYVGAKCPQDVIESGYEEVLEAERLSGAA